MAGSIHDDDEEITSINVTPLVDVMMVLLIIFMVTATYIVHKSINVALPQADTATDSASAKNLAFVLDKDLHLFLDGNAIDFADLAARVHAIREAAPNKEALQALITADKNVPHGQVVKLIDAVRKSGISDFAINVEAPADSRDTPR